MDKRVNTDSRSKLHKRMKINIFCMQNCEVKVDLPKRDCGGWLIPLYPDCNKCTKVDELVKLFDYDPRTRK